MTDSLFFDNDCLSAFLWVGSENLLVKLFPGQVIIPKQVYNELSTPGVAHLKAKVDTLLTSGQISIAEIAVGTEIYDLYYKLTVEPDTGHVIIGKGEAASLDATCAPVDIHYPTDTWLLNEAREKAEDIMDELHKPLIGKMKKPRNYREKARKEYLGSDCQHQPAPHTAYSERKSLG